MNDIVYLNGRFIPHNEARISVHDRGFLYGDGLFDTIRAYRGVAFRIEDHLQRLFDSAAELNLKIGADRADLEKIITELLRRNGIEDAYVRITITRGEHTGDLSFDSENSPTVLIVARPLRIAEDDYSRGVAATIVQNMSNPPDLSRHKIVSYLPYLYAHDMARRSGCREAILTDADGMILESATGNIFVAVGKDVFTPPLTAGILPGIARMTVLELLPTISLHGHEEPLAVKDLAEADEIFMTNSIVEVLPIVRIDERIFGCRPGQYTRQILVAYRKKVVEYIGSRKL